MTEKKLTIGSATFDDFEGVFFTYQALRLAHLDILEDLDFVVIDNNPDSPEGKATKDYCSKAEIRYLPERERRSTAVRDRIFTEAKAPFAMSIDPHVLFEPQTIRKVLAWIEDNPDSSDLIQGPMLYDYLGPEIPATHMKPKWRDNMFGTWGHDKRGIDPEGDPFEIPLHGLGLFLCKTDVFPGFHPLFLGFGGEEGFIHEKIRQQGGNVLCLPFLRWAHRFQRPRGVNYPLIIEERIKNYLIGWISLGKGPDEVLEHFTITRPHIPVKEVLLPEVEELLRDFSSSPFTTAEDYHFKNGKSETWHDTEVDLGAPIEIDIPGGRIAIRNFGLSWSRD